MLGQWVPTTQSAIRYRLVMVKEVSRFCVTPVKGMALLHPMEVLLDGGGVAQDRRFHLVDEDGELFSGSDLGTLVAIRASWEPSTECLTLVFPDGAACSGDSAALGEPVTTAFFGKREVPGHVLEGPWSEAISSHVGREVRLVRTDRPGDAADMYPLTIVSQASVRELARRAGREDDLDSRRFRINVELEGCSAHEEDTWQDQLIRIGDVVLRVLGPIPRCVVTTQDPRTGVKDFDTLRQIATYRARIDGDGGLPFGMYARVEVPGHATVGDVVEVVKVVA